MEQNSRDFLNKAKKFRKLCFRFTVKLVAETFIHCMKMLMILNLH